MDSQARAGVEELIGYVFAFIVLCSSLNWLFLIIPFNCHHKLSSNTTLILWLVFHYTEVTCYANR